MGMIMNDNKLSSVLFNKTRRGLLALLFSHPDESFYVNQILNKLGSGTGSVQRELKALTEAGLITRQRKANLIYYKANSLSPIYEDLRNIVRKTFGVSDILKESLDQLKDKISLAFIFGSLASGRENRTSDIDLMVIGEVSIDEIMSAVGPLQETLGREINPVVYPISEFTQKLINNNHFLNSILEGEKTFLIGDNNELEGMVKRRTPEGT
jgi:predicted nucleotidyltransferase